MKRGLSILPMPASITRQQALEYLPRTLLEEAVRSGKLPQVQRGKFRFYPLTRVLELNRALTAQEGASV